MTWAAALKKVVSERAPRWLTRLRRRQTGWPDLLAAEPRPMLFLLRDIVLA